MSQNEVFNYLFLMKISLFFLHKFHTFIHAELILSVNLKVKVAKVLSIGYVHLNDHRDHSK